MKAYSKEKKEIIQKFQDAVGNSKQKLIIIKNLNKKISISELSKKLQIPQSTMQKAIASFKSYDLIVHVSKKGKSDIYDKAQLLKTFTNLDSLAKVENTKQEDFTVKKIKRKKVSTSSIPFLDSKDVTNAEEMTEPYVLLYVLENSIRKFINKRLTEEYGADWWDKIGVSARLKSNVSDRRANEGINKWHVPRNASEIFYTDLSDLPYFLNKEKDIFGKEINLEYWNPTIKFAVTLSRNIVDHHNYLPKKEIGRLKIILDDWKKEFS